MGSNPRRGLLTLALAVLFCFAGCLGPNHAVGHLYQWNDSFENKWAKEGIFIVALPAYAIFALGDNLIFNSVQWWSGNNPISRPTKHGDVM
jgi:Domain of unknown function (DUF3332)